MPRSCEKTVPTNDPTTNKITTERKGEGLSCLFLKLSPITPKASKHIRPKLNGEPGIEMVKNGINVASNKNGTHSISAMSLKLLNVVLNFGN